MHVLISYSHRDVRAAGILKRALEKYRMQVWLDKHDLPFGNDIVETLRDEIARSDSVLVVITPNSLVSDWVLWEIRYCLEIESLYKETKLIPILMRGNSIPSILAARDYMDFRTRSLMDENFASLIKQVLKASGIQPLEDRQIAYDRLNKEVLSGAEQIIVTAPIVGTLYLAPTPWSKPFVSIGTKVNQGDTLVLVESMKLMNEIESDYDGTVTDILVKDGQSIEYGQPLFLLSAPIKTV
jgi:acetyl-CoA carboxylase biotin carboxyl carrier protein